MILLPPHLLKQYRSFCANSGVRENVLDEYLKWLRFFLDFCEKYQVAGEESDRIRLFLNKASAKGPIRGEAPAGQASGLSLFLNGPGGRGR